jgi:uncharacterized membrane protein YfcA
VTFEMLIAAAAFVAGAIASVAGFGIGSILTPLLSLQVGTRLAVAAISIPHLAATFARFWMLRQEVDRRVLINFGVLSAAGGLAGALLHSIASNPALTLVFAALLMFAGAMSVTGRSRKMRLGPKAAWIAGAVSGMLGGLVGNQGGIRSAALLGFGLNRQAFVATATAIGLAVDAARMPVYFVAEGRQILAIPGVIVSSTLGVLAGTFLGTKLLRRIPEEVFHRIVGVIVLALGVFMMWRAIQENGGQ